MNARTHKLGEALLPGSQNKWTSDGKKAKLTKWQCHHTWDGGHDLANVWLNRYILEAPHISSLYVLIVSPQDIDTHCWRCLFQNLHCMNYANPVHCAIRYFLH